MVCKNLELKPNNKILRNFVGSLDKCKYFKKVRGIHLSMMKEECPLKQICKHYSEQK